MKLTQIKIVNTNLIKIDSSLTTLLVFQSLPYSGGAPLITALVGVHVDTGVIHSPMCLDYVEEGTMRILVAGDSMEPVMGLIAYCDPKWLNADPGYSHLWGLWDLFTPPLPRFRRR